MSKKKSRLPAEAELKGHLVPRDVAALGAVAYSTYEGTAITVNGEELLILTSQDVFAGRSSETEIGAQGTGVSKEPVPSAATQRVVKLLAALGELQVEQASGVRSALLKAMVLSGIDPVPSATVAQAERLARQRGRLLASGAYSIEALRQLRGDAGASTTRTWLTRRRAAGELFSVTHDGQTLVPAFQIDVEGRPLAGMQTVLGELVSAQLGGWATWTWFTAASPWLGGDAPADLLASEIDRVALAARRFAANVA